MCRSWCVACTLIKDCRNPDILKMVHSDETRCTRQTVKILNSEGTIVFARPHSSMLKRSDTSTGEPGSNAEDITLPKALMTYSELRLTPIHEKMLRVKDPKVSLDFYSRLVEMSLLKK